MFNNSGDKVCELPEANISSSDWGQFRRSVLFPPLENCNSIDQQRVSSPLAATVSTQKGQSVEYSWPQKNIANLMSQEEKENSSFDNISLSEKHRLHFPVNINRQFINHSNKKLKSVAKNTVQIASDQTHQSKAYHHNNNNMKFRNLLSNISKAVGGHSSTSPPTSSPLSSQQKGKKEPAKCIYNIYNDLHNYSKHCN